VTFNHEKYIYDCVMSVVEQAKDVDIEILVGDDQSTDETQGIMESIAKEFSDLVTYRRNPKRLGPAGNYQSLIAAARGSYIAHLDGDDLWCPGKLAAQVRFLDENPDCPAVYTNAYTINEDGSFLGLFNNPQKERFDIDELVARGNFLCHSSMMYRSARKPDIIALGVPFIDYRMHLTHAQHGDVGYLNEALVKYRVNSTSSILLNLNDAVRELYWEALLDVPRTSVRDLALTKGISQFGRGIFYASLRRRDWHLFRKWVPRLLAASPAGGARTIWFMLLAILRVGVTESFQILRAGITDKRPRILYRR
jgi:glycosyltransferase involved in cell wall biosynthesis